MSVCSVCGRTVNNFAGNIVRGKSGEWVCAECLKKSGIGVFKFSNTFITSDQVQSLINKRNGIQDNFTNNFVGDNENSQPPTRCSNCGTVYTGSFCPNGCNSPQAQQQKKKNGCLIAFLIVFGVMLLFSAIMGIMFGEETTTTSTNNTLEVSSVEEIKYIEVTANELYNAFSENEVKAEETYNGRNVKITGIVSEINAAETFSSANVLLKVDNAFVGCVQCCFNSSENAKALAELRKGQSVTIVGVCNGLELWNIIITDCKLK